jgi:adenosylhomocysteine nucleosidase
MKPELPLLRGVLFPLSFKVHFGAMASGDEDVIEAERGTSLHQSTGALAVAWEGAGGARACAFSNVPFIEIRGITDAANHDAPADYDNNLELAMSNVAEVLISALDRPLGAKESI